MSTIRYQHYPQAPLPADSPPERSDFINACASEAQATALHSLRAKIAKGEAPLFCERRMTDAARACLPLAAELRGRFSRFVVMGMGGAMLNPQSVAAPAEGVPGNPEIIFWDHVDPDGMKALLTPDISDDCCFLVISKSGATLETMAQFCFFHTHLRCLNVPRPGERFVFLTEAGENPLRAAALDAGSMILEHPADICGRYAGFTLAGLLPGALAGTDVAAFTLGGVRALREFMEGDGGSAPRSVAMFAELIAGGATAHVVMSYVKRALPLTRWYCQIWSESLGKNAFPVIPVAAQGTLDQHSQLQLYLGGKNDKFFTMIGAERSHDGRFPFHAPAALLHSAPWLAHSDMAAVNAASFRATCETLGRGGRAYRSLWMETPDAASFGEFMMRSMLEVALLAELLGINPFDQPHVEEGKRLTRAALAGANACLQPA